MEKTATRTVGSAAKDLSRLEQVCRNECSRLRIKNQLWRKYNQYNQRQFYKEIDDPQGSEQPTPDADEAREFWSNIWDQPVEHRRDAGWLNDLKGETQVEQDDLSIDIEKLRVILRKIPNWKAPGPDNVQGFWLKSVKKLHERIVMHAARIPGW